MSAEAMSSIVAPGGVFAFEFRMEQDTSRAPVPTSATLPRHLPTSCSALKQSWRMKLAVPTPPKPTASRNRRAYFSVCNDLFMWVTRSHSVVIGMKACTKSFTVTSPAGTSRPAWRQAALTNERGNTVAPENPAMLQQSFNAVYSSTS